MVGYQGMRWFRCDLQVQTPEDPKHWDPADPLRLSEPRRPRKNGSPSEDDLQEKARKYLRRCHEVGLEVIGVTDHNFSAVDEPRDWFLTHLIDQNATVAREAGRAPLVVFPGFEVDLGYHVLCLFEPCKSAGLRRISEVLTRLGLRPTARRREDQTPLPLRFDNECVSLATLLRVVQDEENGLVIAAHAFEKSGIADSAAFQLDYINESLLAVEVPSYPLRGRASEILERPSGDWAKRKQRPAYVLSSDAKSTLPGPDGKPKPESLGYRSTWIKMSQPSIEALRQAFLDPRSRLRPDSLDPTTVGHSWISSIAVREAAFVDDQEVFLSPHLNCIIGGRGSGKSSLFEYARFCLRLEDDPLSVDQVARIGKTLGPTSSLRLAWNSPAVAGMEATSDVSEFRPGAGKARVVSRDVIDAPVVFRSVGVQMFSQGQITKLATPENDRPGFLLSVVDQLVGKPLEPLLEEEAVARERLGDLAQKRRQAERLSTDVATLAQEVADLDRGFRAQAAVQAAQQEVRLARESAGQVGAEKVRVAATVKELEARVEEILEGRPALGSEVSEWPEAEFIRGLDQALAAAEANLASAIRASVEAYRTRASELLLPEKGSGRVAEILRQAEEALVVTFQEQGISPGEVDRLRKTETERSTKAASLDQKRIELASLDRVLAEEEAVRNTLHGVWFRQTALRNESIGRILASEAMPKVRDREAETPDAKRSTISVSIRSCLDRADLLDRWGQLVPDARTRLGRSWESIGNAALDAFSADPSTGSPWMVIDRWVAGVAPAPAALGDILEELRSLLRGARRDAWERTRLERIRDAVEVVLYRDDGSKAGSLAKGKLSDGQRNTAVLMLILAGGTGPVFIDQPEEELDSDFIYHQLVPMVRKLKDQRQIVLVTHNANLPVNGDAELIHALEAWPHSDGSAHGRVRASGGLDTEDVKRAVLDVMEGSEAAFERRRQKYRF